MEYNHPSMGQALRAGNYDDLKRANYARSMKAPQVIVGEVVTRTYVALLLTLAALSVGRWSVGLSCGKVQLLRRTLVGE